GSQAVALLINRDADRCTVEDCSLEGYQDTLYIQPRARIANCRIVGGVDFIFGGGAVWFDRCIIVTRFVPNTDSFGYLAAPSTPAAQEFGLVFHRCRIGRERGVLDHSTWLGRPWRAGGNMSLLGQAAFLHCWMDRHIRREGWTSMGYTNPAGERTQLTPQEARMFEYGTTGPGAGPVSATRKLLDAAEARRYTEANVLGGWR
ncbi:MAG: pectinesterase family protein, partial [Sphingomonas sp.]